MAFVRASQIIANYFSPLNEALYFHEVAMGTEICIDKAVLHCIKKGSNPFNRNEISLSKELTIQEIDELLEIYSREDILTVLNIEFLRLEKVVNSKPGGGLAYELQLSDKEAHSNCRSAIQHLNKAI